MWYGYIQGCVSLKESQLASSNIVKSRGREFDRRSCWVVLKCDRRLRNTAPDVKFQSYPATLKTIVATSRFDEIGESQLTFL